MSVQMEEDKEKAIKRLLYKDKREEFKKFVESLKQRNGHVPSSTSSDTLGSARQFIPVFRQDTEDLVSKITEAQRDDASGKAADDLRKDVVTIEEESVTNSSETITVKKSSNSNKRSKKRRHASRLFKSEAGRKSEDDGLVPVNVFLCQMKPLEISEPQKDNPPMISMVPESSQNDSSSAMLQDKVPSQGAQS